MKTGILVIHQAQNHSRLTEVMTHPHSQLAHAQRILDLRDSNVAGGFRHS